MGVSGVGIRSGVSRLGSVTITRNASNYITEVEIIQANKTRTITVTRNSDDYITGLDEAIA